MRYMGIDYGAKRVGIALSDERGQFALPHVVLGNTKHLVDDIHMIIKEYGVTHVVLGESKNYKWEDNPIMKDIHALKEVIEDLLKLPVSLEPEILTSREAEHIQGKNDMHDASAAALILKSYLDREAVQ